MQATHGVSVGSVWSLRGGRTLLGRLREVRGGWATLVVVGLGPMTPEGVEVLPLGAGGAQLVRVRVPTLVERWKQMGR